MAIPRLDDFVGITDDDKFLAAMASNILELQIDRPVSVTQTIVPRSNLSIYGMGKFANNAAAPVYLQKTTAGNLFSGTAGLFDFHIKNLAMLGCDTAAQCVSLVGGPDECSVESCLIKNFIEDAVLFGAAIKCLSFNNRISASASRDVGARGVLFWQGGNINRSEYDYISGYSTGFDSQSAAAVADQVTIESADIAFRVSGGDCDLRNGIVNACGKAIIQAGSFWVHNNFVRNAYPANCVINDPSKWVATWNGA